MAARSMQRITLKLASNAPGKGGPRHDRRSALWPEPPSPAERVTIVSRKTTGLAKMTNNGVSRLNVDNEHPEFSRKNAAGTVVGYSCIAPISKHIGSM